MQQFFSKDNLKTFPFSIMRFPQVRENLYNLATPYVNGVYTP